MLQIKPISLAEANNYVIENHRHHDKVQGAKFAIACYDDDKLVGVAICGRPVSRRLDDGSVIEVTRLCTNGTKNACSILYGRCARIAKEMGYDTIITYILQSESGASLKASGWQCENEKTRGGNWSVPSRQRELFDEQLSLFGNRQKYPTEEKQRWSKTFAK